MPANAVKFPVDFEEKVKRPPAPGGAGYPYQISAKDLMDDFKMAALLVDDTAVGGLKLKETLKNGERTVALDGTLEEGSTLPSGSEGDMLYHNGSGWVPLAAPSAPGAGVLNILTHTGTAPAWDTVTEQSLSICDGGTPTTITVLKR